MICKIRKEKVAETPEEIVRQKTLKLLIDELGYPKELITVEQSLHLLPHLKEHKIPLRRADIICFGKFENQITPLLLIECKKKAFLWKKSILQLISYNLFIKAPFFALVSEEMIKIGSISSKNDKMIFIDKLLSYNELIKNLPSFNSNFF